MTHYGLYGGRPSSAPQAELAALAGYSRGLRRPPIPGAPALWGVGRAEGPQGAVDVPISWADMERDTAWAARMLDLLGVSEGDFCVYILRYSQSAQIWPWMKAGYDRGARCATGMSAFWDAARPGVYLRGFPLRLMFGVTQDILEGLDGAGLDIARFYQPAEILAAMPSAWSRLNAAGLAPWRVTRLAAILTIDPCDGSGGRFDCEQWGLEARDGQIMLSSTVPRARPMDRVPTGVAGRIERIDGEPRFFAA